MFLLGMLTDIQINPDNLFSGFIRIINYPFTIRVRHLVIFNNASIKY